MRIFTGDSPKLSNAGGTCSERPHAARTYRRWPIEPHVLVSFDNRRLVLRKQSTGELLPSAHAVDREYRVLKALASTNVPVPAVLLFCEDRSVIGTPFYVMERLEGRVFPSVVLEGLPASVRREAYFAMAETLPKLHAVDWAAIGLTDYGKPGNFFARQIARWTRQWQTSKWKENADIERLIVWLPDNLPTSDDTTGDFRLGNLMFHPTEPRVIGVLDWELSTLGHPLSDVAYSCMAWQTAPEYDGLRGLDIAALGIPSQAEYLEHYCKCNGRGERVSRFHFAFTFFRFAVILEGMQLEPAVAMPIRPMLSQWATGRPTSRAARLSLSMTLNNPNYP